LALLISSEKRKSVQVPSGAIVLIPEEVLTLV
jgi:hypothetical protein